MQNLDHPYGYRTAKLFVFWSVVWFSAGFVAGMMLL